MPYVVSAAAFLLAFSGGLAFAAQQAPTAALFGWLAALEDQHGIEAVAISVTENADATLQAQGLLVSSPAR